MAPSDGKTYTIGHEPGALDVMQVRTAERWAAQLLPYLRPGMRVLDCGCGPGSISVGLAKAVHPGELVGVDIEPGQTELASRHAAAAGATNVRFEPADAASLPFPDGSFEAIHAHALLMHVPDPLAALREMWRVLAPGGVIGVSDTIIDGWYVTGPDEALLTETFALLQQATLGYGGDWNRGKYLGPLLVTAGFERVEAGAIYRSPADGGPGASGMLIAGMIDGTRMGSLIVEAGLASRAHLDRIVAAWRRLGDYPDGFFSVAEGEAVGWKA